MYVSTGPLLLRVMTFFFSSLREFPISFIHLMSSPTQDGMFKELGEFERPAKLWRGASGVLVIVILGFYCM